MNAPASFSVAPVSAADLAPEWVAMVRGIVQREGQAVRAGAGNTIEVQSINTNQFMPLRLPAGGSTFVNCQERDAILAQLI